MNTTYFGYTVARDGDTLAVGVPDEAGNAAGAVYVFRRNGLTWALEAYIEGSNTEANDRFGHSLALDGDTLAVGVPEEAGAAAGIDGNTLAVGAIGESSAATGIGGDQKDNSADNAGAVYTFHRNNSTWTQDAYLKAFNTSKED